jgi:hypothetical protein
MSQRSLIWLPLRAAARWRNRRRRRGVFYLVNIDVNNGRKKEKWLSLSHIMAYVDERRILWSPQPIVFVCLLVYTWFIILDMFCVLRVCALVIASLEHTLQHYALRICDTSWMDYMACYVPVTCTCRVTLPTQTMYSSGSIMIFCFLLPI